MASKTRIARIQGAGMLPQDGQIGWLTYGAAVPGGTIFMRNPSDDDALQISTNHAQYVSFVDMVAVDTTFKWEKARGIDSGIEVDKPLKVLNLVPGIEFEIETFNSDSSGAYEINSSTAGDAALGVDANGQLCAKQSSGDGSSQLFTLLANHIAARKTIEVRYTP